MRWLLIGIAAFPVALNAAVYKCKVDGATVYTSSPCVSGGTEIHVQETPALAKPGGNETGDASNGPGLGEEKTTRHSERAYLAQREIDKKSREIKKHKKNIKRYRKRMRSELAALKRKKGYARNNLAGATWEQSISTEMRSVTEKYQQMIDSEKYDIDALKDEIKELRKHL